MALSPRKARQICKRYYLDCASIADIAAELHVSREAVRACVDDPAVQADYLRHMERARQRTRMRSASAAELALDRQISFLSADMSAEGKELVIEQQRTAERVLKRALAPDRESDRQITIRWEGEPVTMAMPPSDDDSQRGGNP